VAQHRATAAHPLFFASALIGERRRSSRQALKREGGSFVKRYRSASYAVLALVAVVLTAACSSDSPTGVTPQQTGGTISGTLVTNLTLEATGRRGVVGLPYTEEPCACSSSSGGVAATGDDLCSTTNKTRANGVTVTVVGTSISTTTDGDGKFTLTGVPAGSITLKFSGEGVDATISVSGLTEGQTLTLVVEVAGKNATVWNEGNTKHEMEYGGRIDSITPPDLVVSGQLVHTKSDTLFVSDHGTANSIHELQLGMVVKVFGTLESDGSITAWKVKARDEEKGCSTH
jgi:hypothetical protein